MGIQNTVYLCYVQERIYLPSHLLQLQILETYRSFQPRVFVDGPSNTVLVIPNSEDKARIVPLLLVPLGASLHFTQRPEQIVHAFDACLNILLVRLVVEVSRMLLLVAVQARHVPMISDVDNHVRLLIYDVVA